MTGYSLQGIALCACASKQFFIQIKRFLVFTISIVTFGKGNLGIFLLSLKTKDTKK
jgi:hypothetical protein